MDLIAIKFEVVILIDSMKISSLHGVDNMNSKFLWITKYLSSLFLILIFQQSLDTGLLSNDWKIGKDIPIHKSRDKNPSLKYRPISLTSVASELFEHIIYKHTIIFLDSNSFYSNL